MDQPKTPDSEIIEDDRFEVREALGSRLANIWWTFFLRGLMAACVGIAALFWPTSSIALLLQFVGLLLVLDGGLALFGLGRRSAAGGVGIGSILIGVVLLIWPEGTARFSFALLGAFALINGIGSLLTWRQLPEQDPERLSARNAGIVASLIGLCLIFWPGTGLVTIGWAIAFAAISVSAIMFWLAFRFKNAKERLKIKMIDPL